MEKMMNEQMSPEDEAEDLRAVEYADQEEQVLSWGKKKKKPSPTPQAGADTPVEKKKIMAPEKNDEAKMKNTDPVREDAPAGEVVRPAGDEDVDMPRVEADRNARGSAPDEGEPVSSENDAVAAPEVPASRRPVVEVGEYDADTTRAMINLTMADRNGCFIRCGDHLEEEEAPARVASTAVLDARLAAIGFPPRPGDWPVMMSWPSARDLEILERRKADRDFIDAYVANLMQMNDAMRQRSETMRSFLDENREKQRLREARARNARVKGNETPDQRRQRRAMARQGLDHREIDPHRGIRFALMLDPAAVGANTHLVASWSEDVIRTRDGCNIYASGDTITFRVDPIYRDEVSAVTDQAIMLSIREGMSRGWKTFDVSGSRKFAKNFERKALEMGVSARISYGWGPFRKTIKVDPPVPAVGEQGLQWQPDLSGAAPRTSRKAGAMIETRPASDDQAGPPRTSRKMARRPADGERGAEVEDDRGAGPGPQHA